MAVAARMHVEVAYARPDRQWLLALEVDAGATAQAVLLASGLLEECPELRCSAPVLGVWSRRVAADTALESGDRLEVYRPLLADPKTARRTRAARQRASAAAALRGALAPAAATAPPTSCGEAAE